MSKNEIILLAIVVLVGIFLVFGIYFTYIFIKNKVSTKKVNSIFSPEKLAEEESLMNYMDEKKNIEYNIKEKESTFIHNTHVDIVKNETREEQINPFGIDLTKKNENEKDYIKEEEERASRKFFK